MSLYADEQYAVYDERFPRARKEHKCDACGDCIQRGDRYTRVGIVFDGEAYSVIRCLRCQTIHEHLRTLDKSGEMWPDEWLDCGEEYTDHWGKEPPPEIAALAFTNGHEMQEDGRQCTNQTAE